MEESAELFRHKETGEIYAIRRKWNGELVGSAGPLTAEDFKDIQHILVTPDLNYWIEENGPDLILIDADFDIPEELKEAWQYIKELTESLYEWDNGFISWSAELPRLQETIQRLKGIVVDKSIQSKIQSNAQKCQECILKRLGIGN